MAQIVSTNAEIASTSEKIKYWWSEDRQWFCILVNDGTCRATISLSIAEAEALMDEVMRTPDYLALEKEAAEQAIKMVHEAISSENTPST